MNIEELRNRVESEISSLKTFEDLKRVKAFLLGRKGLFSEYLDTLRSLDKEEKRTFGKEINSLKSVTEDRLKELESFYIEDEKRKEAFAKKTKNRILNKILK